MGLGFSVAGLTFNTTDSRCCRWSPRSCVGHRVLGLFSEFQLCPPLPAGPAHLRYTGSRAPVSGWVDFCCLYVVPDLLWARRVPFPWSGLSLTGLFAGAVGGGVVAFSVFLGQLESALCLWGSGVGGSLLSLPWEQRLLLPPQLPVSSSPRSQGSASTFGGEGFSC